MADTPRVSVLMGVHNGQRYVREAVASVLDQTMGDLELIVVDDASSDQTAQLLAAFDDARLVLLRNEENIGLTRSLNSALSAARGEYVARQDADDRSLPARFQRQLEFMEANPEVALCGTWATLIGADGDRVGSAHPPTIPDELATALFEDNKIFHGSLFARRTAIQAVGGYREAFRYSQDYDLYLRLLEHHRLANVPEELYAFRFHAESITGSKQDQQHRFRELARVLAVQRREHGQDELEAGTPVEDLLDRITTDQESADYWRLRALYARRMGDLRGYRRALRQALRRAPSDPVLYAQLIISLGGRRALARAEQFATRRQ